MKIKTTLMMLMTTMALTMTPIFRTSHSKGLTPKTTESFSTFSVPQNLGATVNSVNTNELPVIAPSGLSLYLSSTRAGGQGGNDIWVSQRATLSSAWGAAQNLGVINTNTNEVPGSISPDGREMFFNSTRAGGVGGPDLWLSTRTDPNNDFGWTTPVNLGAVINTTFSENNPNYFVDPATGAGTLFFTSDRSSGTSGVKDIYQSTRNPDGTFNPPVPVNELNSTADDNKTAISRDGLEIFFSSNRIGRAIFVSTRASTTAQWNPPVPVGSLNAGGTAAQPSLSPDGTVVYFASDRPGGFGIGDIYSAVRVNINRSVTADFDGDGRTDLSVFRPSDGTWHFIQSSTNTYGVLPFGLSTDKIVSGDYDGDGRTDFAVFRPTSGVWYVLRSSDSLVSTIKWGVSTDKPVPGDYDGDGRTDFAVYRDGTWYLLQSTNGVSIQQFGLADDRPVPLTYLP